MTELNLSERSSLNVSQFIILSQTIVKAVKLYCSFILGKTGFPPKCTVHMWYPDSWNQFLELTYIKMTVNINIKILYSINVITYRSYNRKITKMPSVKTISLILFFFWLRGTEYSIYVLWNWISYHFDVTITSKYSHNFF